MADTALEQSYAEEASKLALQREAIRVLVSTGLAVTDTTIGLWIVKDGDEYVVDGYSEQVVGGSYDKFDDALDYFLKTLGGK